MKSFGGEWRYSSETAPLKLPITIISRMICQIQKLLSERKELGHLNAEEFMRDAVRRLVQSKYPTTFGLKPQV